MNNKLALPAGLAGPKSPAIAISPDIRSFPVRHPNVLAPARHVLSGRRLLCLLLLVAVAIATYQTSARDEDFWWGDGASFALNGEFLRDYLASGFRQTPMAFALEWFRRYPALTISLYPPIFPLAEALVFAIAGFSHAAAQATVTLFAAAALYGMLGTMRTAVGVLPATGAAVMLFATPEVLRWSRQIVLDVPAMALLLLAAAALLRYQVSKSARSLMTAVLLTLAAIYTKQTALFVVPAFAVAVVADEGRSLARRRTAWIAAAVGVAGLVPLAAFTMFYAAENFHIAFGTGTGQKGYDRLSVQALMAYARVLPDIVGIVPLAGAAAYLALAGIKGWRDRNERRLAVLMVAWFVADYLGISVTADFEPRYATLLAVPIVALTILLITRLLAERWAGPAALAASMGLFAFTISSQPVLRVEGYDDVAQYVLDHTKQDDTILFHGVGSKNFTFSVRTRSPIAKIFILRAEKFLVDYTITRDWGIADRNLSRAGVEAIVDRNRISYIVFQPNFWTDQPSIAALQRLIDDDRFRLVGQFPITSEDLSRSTLIRVYRNTGPEVGGAITPASLPLGHDP